MNSSLTTRLIIVRLVAQWCVLLLHGASGDLLAAEIDAVETLVRQWSPIIWLAPNEKFMPGDVKDFLRNVHAQRPKPTPQIKDINEHPNMYAFYNKYYELEDLQSNELSSPDGSNRNKRNHRDLEPEFDLPMGETSEKWYLVTNKEVELLKTKRDSFLYGKDPSRNSVPVYAMVDICTPTVQTSLNEISYKPIESYVYQPFPGPVSPSPIYIPNSETEPEPKLEIIEPLSNRTKRSIENGTETNDTSWKAITPSISQPIVVQIATKEPIKRYPSFHVTYWMFYPYSQGKTMCLIDLGPLGPWPFPLIFGICLGTRREVGSHVGDWEHVSLSFSGRGEPDEMYVSAHDAGAFYTYNSANGLFEFKSQETRKGVFQKPNFPKTVRTSYNHPVLFAAEGSHGVWSAPGKHRYVRVPRLYDINGFGIPWTTWKNIEIFFENGPRDQRSLKPNWLKFRGRWGNPKTKCHPLYKLGLHYCENSDGPTGIPRKKSNFYCKSTKG